MNVAEYMLNRLADWGIGRIYGYPGEGINGLLGAFHEAGDRIEFTQTAHEVIASPAHLVRKTDEETGLPLIQI